MNRYIIETRNSFLAFASDDSAGPSVEFVVVAPILFWLVFSVFEAGWLMTQQTMLSRGLNMAAREIRVGGVAGNTVEEKHKAVKEIVCKRARVLRDCMQNLHMQLSPVDMASGLPAGTTACVDRTGKIEPVLEFSPGGSDSVTFIRACVIVDPLLPGMGLGAQLTKDDSGGYSIVAFTAFANE